MWLAATGDQIPWKQRHGARSTEKGHPGSYRSPWLKERVYAHTCLYTHTHTHPCEGYIPSPVSVTAQPGNEQIGTPANYSPSSPGLVTFPESRHHTHT